MNDAAHGLRPALVLDGALMQSLATVRSLGRAGLAVHVAETHAQVPAFASRWCASQTVLPDFAHDPPAFVARVLALCERLGRPVLITSHDGSIEALRAQRQQVEAVATLALAPEPALAQAIDKRATLAAAQRIGLSVPAGATVGDLAAARQALQSLQLPVVVKPASSWLGHGASAWRAAPRLAATREQALEQIGRLLEGGVDVLLQPWLSGRRETVTLLRAGERVRAAFAQRALRVYPLLGGADVLRESIAMPADIGDAARALVRELALEGFAQVEFRRDSAGQAYLMEINSRLSASVETAVRAGVDFPLLLYRWAAGEPVAEVSSYRSGYRMRYLGGDVGWLKETLRDRQHPDAQRPAAAVASFALSFARPCGYDYWDRGDRTPAAQVARGVVRSLPARLLRAARAPRSLAAVQEA